MSDADFGWLSEEQDEEMRRLQDRAARQHVESLVLRLSGELGTPPDHLRRLIEAELEMPIWEAHPEQLRGCAAALEAVYGLLRQGRPPAGG